MLEKNSTWTIRMGDKYIPMKCGTTQYVDTDIPEIIHFLAEFRKNTPWSPKGKIILDPCAGGDENTSMSYPEAMLRAWGVNDVHTLDIREDSRAGYEGDYLKVDVLQMCGGRPDMIITNPPFMLFEEIARRALEDLAPHGLLILLMRIEAFESATRFPFWGEHMATDAYVHHKRKITGGRVRAPTHFIWQKGFYPEFCRTRVI